MVALPAPGAYSGAATEGELKQWGEDIRSFIAQMPGGRAVAELTIAAGAILPTGGAHTVDTEGDAESDTLGTIQLDNLPDGALLAISPASAAREVIVAHGAGGTGQILLRDAAPLALRGVRETLLLQRRGSDMVELLRNPAPPAPLAPPALGDDQDDWAPEGFGRGTAWLRVDATASVAVTGLAAGYDGQVVPWTNVGDHDQTLRHEDADSAAANRFATDSEGDETVAPGATVWLLYDGQAARWRVFAGGGGVYTERYESAVQTITAGGGLALAHGLSGKPSANDIAAKIVCLTAEANYSVGQEVPVPINAGFREDVGLTVHPTATHLNVRMATGASSGGSVFRILDPTTGNAVNLTNNRWGLSLGAKL
jgi:hypothetical protein